MTHMYAAIEGVGTLKVALSDLNEFFSCYPDAILWDSPWWLIEEEA